jgi:hypothetical protein
LERQEEERLPEWERGKKKRRKWTINEMMNV